MKNQTFEIGQTVNIGFVRGLKVIERINGEWILESAKGVRYSFVPHNGLCRIN
jgi:hypothetical protein